MSDRIIDEKIKRLGFTPFKVKKEKPSYYKLQDGTILKIYPILNGLILNAKKPNMVTVDIGNVVSAFVPKKLLGERPDKIYSLTEANKKMDIEDMDFNILAEPFNEYSVGKHNLKLKTILNQVNRSKLRNNLGQPIYAVNTSISTKFKKR